MRVYVTRSKTRSDRMYTKNLSPMKRVEPRGAARLCMPYSLKRSDMSPEILYRRSPRTNSPESTSVIEETENVISTQIARILDCESKTEAIRILAEGISSIPEPCISGCVFSSSERLRFHTWGLYTRTANKPKLISVVVFRRHVRLGLIELRLVATDKGRRRGGCGTQLLHHLTGQWKAEGFSYVMTFADPSAVPFFASLRFASKIPFPRDLYDCWIDKYSHSVLMCQELEGHPFDNHIADAVEFVEVLVFIENSDRRPVEVWVQGIASEHVDAAHLVEVVYSYQLRTYREWLSEDSVRIRLPTSRK